MNGAFLPDLFLVETIVACLLAPPFIGGLVSGVARRYDAIKGGRIAPSLLQPFQEVYVALRKKPGTGSYEVYSALVLSMTLQLAALGMLGLLKNLLPVLFLQAAGLLAMIMAGMFRPVPFIGLSGNHALKAFLTREPILFLVAAGVFFATGSFSLAAVAEYPRLLAIDLPLLCVVLLFIEQESRREPNDVKTESELVFMKLANCYRCGTLLLFAGFFFAHSLIGAVIAAILLHIVLVGLSYVPVHISSSQKAKWGWGYVYFATALNLSWIYIKYWQ